MPETFRDQGFISVSIRCGGECTEFGFVYGTRGKSLWQKEVTTLLTHALAILEHDGVINKIIPHPRNEQEMLDVANRRESITDTRSPRANTSASDSRSQEAVDQQQQPEVEQREERTYECTTLADGAISTASGSAEQVSKAKAKARQLAEFELEEIELSEQEIRLKKRKLQARNELLELDDE